MMRTTYTVKLTISAVFAVVVALSPMASVMAAGGSPVAPANDPNTLVCDTLARIGMPCATTTVMPTLTPNPYEPKPIRLSFFGSSATPAPLPEGATGVIRDVAGNSINLVRVPGTQEIYALVNGQKHWIPTLAIFYDYGYTMDQVESITQTQLNRYPRASLIRVQGNTKKIYYLTQGGMTRMIPNPKVFESYGNHQQDVISISQREFNYYPANQYVYLENASTRDVYKITTAGKHYIIPPIVLKLGLRSEQIAPINQTELDSYKTLAPIVQ